VTRIEAPLSVKMPRRCCRCATVDDVDLVATHLWTDVRRFAMRVPFCAPCLRAERRDKLVYRATVLAVALLVLVLDLHPAWRVRFLLGTLGLWMAYPHLGQRPLRLLHVDEHRVAIFSCRNDVFAEHFALVPGARYADAPRYPTL
jgi:hypothetical protein